MIQKKIGVYAPIFFIDAHGDVRLITPEGFAEGELQKYRGRMCILTFPHDEIDRNAVYVIVEGLEERVDELHHPCFFPIAVKNPAEERLKEIRFNLPDLSAC